MKILIATTSSNNVYTFLDSLRYLGMHEMAVFHYDQKWHEQVAIALQSNPSIKDQLHAGQFHLPPERVSRDAELLDRVQTWKPDVILYISAWEGDFVPTDETLGELNTIAPLVHFCCDGADPPWWPLMRRFEEKGIFSLTVSIDGAKVWPGTNEVSVDNSAPFKIKNSLTLLTPVDPRNFLGASPIFPERPYAIGYAGNAGGWTRSALVQRLQRLENFSFRPRDDHLLSYPHYCKFLQHVRVSITVPFTGSGAAKHVKGRVIESAYAGACLLEWRNDAMRSWFTPREDYFEYESVEECIEMATWLAGHSKIAGEMAASLQNKVLTQHSPEKFWGTLLERASACRP